MIWISAEQALHAGSLERPRRQIDVALRGVPLTGGEDFYALREILRKISDAINCDISNREYEFIRILHIRTQNESGHKTHVD